MFSSQKGFPSSTPFGGAGSSVFSQSSGFTFGSQPPQPTQSTGPFGTSTFGQPQQTTQQSTGLFGTQTQPTQAGGLFGAANPAGSVFGAKSTFGAASTGGFGTTTTGTGLFGSASAAPTAAPPTAGTGLFGSAAPSGGGLFGSVAPAAGGTTTKFVPPTSTDTAQRSGSTVTVNTKHQCITAMKEYESKSLEELRLEDYAANRKGPQSGAPLAAPGGGGIFGSASAAPAFGSFAPPAASTTGGIFGSAAQPTGTGLFGSAGQKSLFGGGGGTTTTSSVFGATSKPLFEAPGMGANKGLFGAAPGTSSGGFLFGQTNTAQPAASTGGLFGTKPTFGTTTTSAGGFGTGTGGFGTGTGGLFGGGAGTGLFGAKTTGGFGFGTTSTATTAAAPFSFGTGTSTAGGGLFGANPAQAAKPTGFGFPTTSQTTGPTIGSAAPFGQTLFGQPAAGTNATANRPLFSGTGTGGLGFNFGGTQSGLGIGGPGVLGQAQAPNQPAAIGLSDNPDVALAQQARIQQKVLDLVVNLPYGHSSLFKNPTRTGGAGGGPGAGQPDRPLPIPTNPESQRAATQQMRLNLGARASPKPRTRPLGVVPNGAVSPGLNSSSRRQLFSGLDEEELARADNFFVRRSDWKKLHLPTGSNNSSVCTETPSAVGPLPAPSNGVNGADRLPSPRRTSSEIDFPAQTVGPNLSEVNASPTPRMALTEDEKSPRDEMSELPGRPRSLGPETPGGGPGMVDISCWRGPEDDDPSMLVLPDSSSQPEPHPCNVVLTKAGYYTIPSLDEIAEQGLDAGGRCIIENLVVGHKGYGRVLFFGMTDVAGLDLDAAVHIRRKEITVYPDDSDKPKVGEGLNKRSEVTLTGVWPTDKATGEPIKDATRLDKMRFSDRLERATSKMGARFIEYQPDSGSWVFEVKHFSKYRYDESDDSDEEEDEKAKTLQQKDATDDRKVETAEVRKSVENTNQSNEDKVPEDKPEESEEKTPDLPVVKEGRYRLADDEPWLAPKDSDGMSSSEGDAAALAVEGLIDELPPWQLPSRTVEEESRGRLLGPRMGSSARMLGGVSSHSVQLMKASFFGAGMDLDTMDEMDAMEERVEAGAFGGVLEDEGLLSSPALDAHWQPKRQRLFTQLSPTAAGPTGRTALGQPLGATRASPRHATPPRRALPPLLPADPSPVAAPPGMVRESESRRLLPPSLRLPLPAGLKRPQLAPPVHPELWLDAGLLRGAACRVAWAPDALAFPPAVAQSRATLSDAPSLADGDAPVWTSSGRAARLLMASLGPRAAPGVDERLLNLSLDSSALTAGSCPLWAPRPGRRPLAAYDRNLGGAEARLGALRRAVDLCSALWGRLEHGAAEADDDEEDEEEDDYAIRMDRKEALSTWLREQVMPATEEAVATAKEPADVVFAWLVAGCLPEACAAAQRAGEHRLALLVAQARGSDCVRRMLIRQLEEWREVGMDSRISAAHLRVYALLAGHMTWRRSCPDGGGPLDRSPDAADAEPVVNVCGGLDWVRALAVHLWYQCSFEQDVAHALHAYKAAFRGPDRYAAAPTPAAPGVDPDEMDAGPGAVRQHWDVAYHLLQLHCKRHHRLERLLCPQTLGRGPLDWEAVWHLWRILDALGYNHLAPVRAAQLHAEFADQLERAGLWEWAAFVLLHLPDAARREASVRALLARRLGEAEPEEEDEDEDEEEQEQADGGREARRERFLVERLRVPHAWIYEAKAVRARSHGDPVAEARLWTEAQRWEEAHAVLMGGLGARLAATGSVEQLRALLEPLSRPAAFSNIRQWSLGGQLFLDWAHLREQADDMVPDDAYAVEKARHALLSVCDRLELMHARSAHEKMCRSAMARDCARLLRRLTADAAFVDEAARLLSQLPLPEDERLAEARFLTCRRLAALQAS